MARKKTRRNVYRHSIDLKELEILNAPREEFRRRLEEIPYRGYEVERISDGRRIVIAKPGGKSVYGRPKKEDFFVWVYDPAEQTLWQISHKQILEDLEAKLAHDASNTLKIIECLERVHRGEEPDDVLGELTRAARQMPGESPEVLMKAYKWIWGQEDVNYPDKKGRDMSMESVLALKSRLQDRKTMQTEDSHKDQ